MLLITFGMTYVFSFMSILNTGMYCMYIFLERQ